MSIYRKKPVEIEAFKLGVDNPPMWFTMETSKKGLITLHDNTAKGDFVKMNDNPNLTATIKTLEGNHLANNGDYIIKGVKGELYPCKPDIFELTYEKISD